MSDQQPVIPPHMVDMYQDHRDTILETSGEGMNTDAHRHFLNAAAQTILEEEIKQHGAVKSTPRQLAKKAFDELQALHAKVTAKTTQPKPASTDGGGEDAQPETNEAWFTRRQEEKTRRRARRY